MLALVVGVSSFQAGAPAPVASRAAVCMSDRPTFGDNPKYYPVKNVWTTVCKSSDLKPSTLKACFGAGQDVLIATDKGGRVFAAANVCPHIGTPLDQGTVEDDAIVCPLHRSAFSLRTGKLVGPWCPAPPLIGPLTGKLKSPRSLQTFQARQQGGRVQVLLDINAKKRFEGNYWRGVLDSQGKVDGGYY